MYNLPSYLQVCEYKTALDKWNSDCKKFDDRIAKEAKVNKQNLSDCKKRNKNQRPQKPDFEHYLTSGKKDVDFEFYVAKVFNATRDFGTEFNDLRISSHIKQYLSNLCLDFCNRLVPWVNTIIQCKNIKTVGWDVIMTAIDLMLTDGGNAYYIPNIRGSVEDRINKLHEYEKHKKSKGETLDDEEEDEEEYEDEEEPETEPEPEPEPEPETTSRRRRRGN